MGLTPLPCLLAPWLWLPGMMFSFILQAPVSTSAQTLWLTPVAAPCQCGWAHSSPWLCFPLSFASPFTTTCSTNRQWHPCSVPCLMIMSLLKKLTTVTSAQTSFISNRFRPKCLPHQGKQNYLSSFIPCLSKGMCRCPDLTLFYTNKLPKERILPYECCQ